MSPRGIWKCWAKYKVTSLVLIILSISVEAEFSPTIISLPLSLRQNRSGLCRYRSGNFYDIKLYFLLRPGGLEAGAKMSERKWPERFRWRHFDFQPSIFYTSAAWCSLEYDYLYNRVKFSHFKKRCSRYNLILSSFYVEKWIFPKKRPFFQRSSE